MVILSVRGNMIFLTLAVMAAALAGCASAPAPSPAVPTTFTVDVGYEDLAQAYQVEAFFPKGLTVNVGDSVAFTMKSHEAHTVTFHAPSPVPKPLLSQPDHGLAANPLVFLPSPRSEDADPGAPVDRVASFDGTGFVSSGLLATPGDRFTVTFTAPGTWTAVCLFHVTAMTATFIVNPKGTPRPMTEADYRQAAAAQVKDAQAKAADMLAELPPPASTANADGTRSYLVWAGAGSGADGIDCMRFVGGEQLTIKTGDSVTFDVSKNAAGVLHTVTFLAGTEAPEPDGSPALLMNPRILAPAPWPPAPFDGETYTSSGVLAADGPTPQAYTVTFIRAGTFPYRCLLHDSEGMKGTIVVQP